MSFLIAKDFSFCYGHRVWNQELNQEFALTNNCKCKHLHGHEAKVTVTLSASELHKGMVTDFNNLAWFNKFLNDYLDHKFIIDLNDPLYNSLTHGYSKYPIKLDEKVIGHKITTNKTLMGCDSEYLESFFIVDFVPTSENFCKWIYDIVQNKMSQLNVNVKSVEWWESPKSRAYYGN